MEISSVQLPFEPPPKEEDYLAQLCSFLGTQLCSVPSNGGCFFDSIFASLPTVGKAVKSSKALRQEIVAFFRECCSTDQHGELGERVQKDITDQLQHKIVSSYAATRFNNKKPKTIDAYLEAVSMNSVWVEGVYTNVVYLLASYTRTLG